MADVSSFFKTSIEESKKRVGASGKVLVHEEEESSQRGIPAPGLALRYLFHSGILPFGKLLGLAGKTKAMKSAFGFMLGSLAARWGGGFHLIENESKLNEHFMYSFFPPELRDRIQVDYVESVDEAQVCMTNIINRYKKLDPSERFPLVLGLDSLAGSGTLDEYGKINKAGYADRAFPEAALKWSTYFKKLSSDLATLDILLYFTNHLKKSTDQTPFAGTTYTKQGGVSQDFHAAQYLYFERVADINLVSREGKLIQIKAEKCGLGPDNRKIHVPVLWEFDLDEDGEPQQRTWWDWYDATAKLLADGSKVVLPKRVQAQLDVKCAANRYSSKELNISNLEGTEFGEAVMADEEYVEGFRKVCGYKNWTTIGTPPTD
jgi:hypothetical protein